MEYLSHPRYEYDEDRSGVCIGFSINQIGNSNNYETYIYGNDQEQDDPTLPIQKNPPYLDIGTQADLASYALYRT